MEDMKDKADSQRCLGAFKLARKLKEKMVLLKKRSERLKLQSTEKHSACEGKKGIELVTELERQEKEIQSLHKQMEQQKEAWTRQERDRRPYPWREVEALKHRLADM